MDSEDEDAPQMLENEVLLTKVNVMNCLLEET